MTEKKAIEELKLWGIPWDKETGDAIYDTGLAIIKNCQDANDLSKVIYGALK